MIDLLRLKGKESNSEAGYQHYDRTHKGQQVGRSGKPGNHGPGCKATPIERDNFSSQQRKNAVAHERR